MGLVSAGELGIGNPGSYGGENTTESMHDEFGAGEDNPYGSDEDVGEGAVLSSFLSRFKTNYNNILNELYGDDLGIADTLGAWGIGSAILSTAVSSLQGVTDFLATEQIANAKIAGALKGGNIFSRIRASNVGTKIALRTTALRAGLRATGAISSVVGAGATGYSIGARLNAAGHALCKSF